MKKKILRLPLLFLLVALITGAGFLSGRMITELVHKFDLISRWRPLDGLPEEVEELLVPGDGTAYVRGVSGKIYRSCERIQYGSDCWKEAEYPTHITQWECSELADIPKPPSDTVASVMNCIPRHRIEITGLALSSDNKLWGYYATSQSAFGAIGRGLIIILLSTIIGFVLGIWASVKVSKMLNERDLNEAAT